MTTTKVKLPDGSWSYTAYGAQGPQGPPGPTGATGAPGTTAEALRGIRNAAIAALGRVGTGQWFIKRRGADEHRIVRMLADGHCVEWVLGRTVTERHLIGHQRPMLIQAGQTGGIPMMMYAAEQGVFTGAWTHSPYQTANNPPTPVPSGWVTSIVPASTPPYDHQGYERIPLVVNAASGSANVDFPPFTVTTKVLTGNVATLTIGVHSLVVGNTVFVAGVDATFNGTFLVTAVTGTTISYARTNADVTSAAATGTATYALPNGFAYYASRMVRIAGAGASGAEFVGRVTNVTTNNTRIVLQSASGLPSTTVTNAAAIVLPGRYQTSGVGDTATWTSPVCTDLGVALGMNSNGALVSVSVDGSLTAANLCPTAQQMADAGVILATDLTTGGGSIAPTTRLLHSWAGAPIFGLPRAIARNLASAAHTVVLTNLSAKPINSTTGNFFVVTGWAGSSTASMLTTGVAACTMDAPVRWFGNDEVALTCKPVGATNSDLCGGEGHGFENETQPLQIVLNGATQTLADGQCIAANGAIMTRRSDLYHIDDQTTPVARERTVYRLEDRGLVVTHYIEWLKNLSTSVGSYLVQLDVTPLYMVQLDNADTATSVPTVAEGDYIGTGHNLAAAFWAPGQRHLCGALIPQAKEVTDNWTSNLQTTIRRMFPGAPTGGQHQHSKLYVQMQRLAVTGDRWTCEVVYLLNYLPGNAERYLPATAVGS